MRSIEKEVAPEVVQLGLIGDLDLATVPHARTHFRRLIEDGWSSIILNLESCEFVDSAGIGVIIGMRRRAHMAGVGFVMLNVGPLIRVFQASGVQDLFVCADSEPMAISLLSQIDASSTGAFQDNEQD